MIKDFFEFTAIFIGFLFAVAIFIFGVVALGSATLGQYTCYTLGRDLNIETKWTFGTGCHMNVNGQNLPMSEISPFLTKEGKIIFVPKAQVIMLQRAQ